MPTTLSGLKLYALLAFFSDNRREAKMKHKKSFYNIHYECNFTNSRRYVFETLDYILKWKQLYEQ